MKQVLLIKQQYLLIGVLIVKQFYQMKMPLVEFVKDVEVKFYKKKKNSGC